LSVKVLDSFKYQGFEDTVSSLLSQSSPRC